jgi:hypothetical protein
MTTILALPGEVFDTSLSYLSPPEVRALVTENPKDEVLAIIRNRFNGETELWIQWAEAYGVQAKRREKSIPSEEAYPWPAWSNPYEFSSSKCAVTHLFSRVNDAVIAILSSFEMDPQTPIKYGFSSIVDPFIKRTEIQRELFLFGDIMWPLSEAISSNLHVVHLFLEAAFPNEFLRQNRVKRANLDNDVRIFKVCYNHGMPFVEMYLRAGGPLNDSTLKIILNDPQDNLILLLKAHLSYLSAAGIKASMKSIFDDPSQRTGDAHLANPQQKGILREAFVLLRSELIKRRIDPEDQTYLQTTRQTTALMKQSSS